MSSLFFTSTCPVVQILAEMLAPFFPLEQAAGLGGLGSGLWVSCVRLCLQHSGLFEGGN